MRTSEPTAAVPRGGPEPARNLRKTLSTALYKYWLLLFTLMVALFFGLFEPQFFAPKNLLNILSSACLTAIAGIGVTCVMSSGEMDISSGSHLTMGAVLMVMYTTKLGLNYFLAILLTIVSLAGIGLLNATMHIRGRIPAFIATMGTQFVFNGVAKLLCNGTDLLGVSAVTVSYYTFIGQGYLFGFLPMPLVMLILVSALMIVYTEHTRSGKYLYAVGSNPQACKYIGINSNFQKYKGFTLCAVLCGLSGIIQGSMVNGCTPTLGATMMTYAIIVLMLGAMFNKVGVFNIPGTIVGAVLLAIINNGLIMMNAATFVKDFVLGLLLFVAVTAVVIIKKRVARA